jgi:shikimate dehydrogenase
MLKRMIVDKTGTRMLMVMGDPIAHSQSPLMHNAALQKAGIQAVYGTSRVPKEKIGAALDAIRTLGIWGTNLTVPLKEAALPFLDDVDDVARLVGAVNTVVNCNGKLSGYNTDVYGISTALKLDLDFEPLDKSAVLLGAGGACRAGIVALCRAGIKHLGIANRSIERAKSLADEFSRVYPDVDICSCHLTSEDLAEALKGADLVINSTAIGLKGETFSDFPWHSLSQDTVVFDMVYGTHETPFVSAAKAHGHRAVNGLGMLAAQGEKAFELWTGAPPAQGLMRSCLLSR